MDQFHWPTVFLANHDNPRMLSKFGDDSTAFRIPSAKLLAMLLLTQKGTAFLYQGDEIGMTNYPFTSFSQFDDVEIKGNYKQVLASGVMPEKYLAELNKSGRDHARTPMQWTADKQGGFTTADKSWLAINPNYKTINVKSELQDPHSIFNFYKQLLAIRKGNDDLIYGDYTDIAPADPNVFAYTRKGKNNTYLVVLNMSGQPVTFNTDSKFKGYQLVIANQPVAGNTLQATTMELAPWQAMLYKRK